LGVGLGLGLGGRVRGRVRPSRGGHASASRRRRLASRRASLARGARAGRPGRGRRRRRRPARLARPLAAAPPCSRGVASRVAALGSGSGLGLGGLDLRVRVRDRARDRVSTLTRRSRGLQHVRRVAPRVEELEERDRAVGRRLEPTAELLGRVDWRGLLPTVIGGTRARGAHGPEGWLVAFAMSRSRHAPWSALGASCKTPRPARARRRPAPPAPSAAARRAPAARTPDRGPAPAPALVPCPTGHGRASSLAAQS
jgi:alkylhydroperoxidase family enzyme